MTPLLDLENTPLDAETIQETPKPSSPKNTSVQVRPIDEAQDDTSRALSGDTMQGKTTQVNNETGLVDRVYFLIKSTLSGRVPMGDPYGGKTYPIVTEETPGSAAELSETEKLAQSYNKFVKDKTLYFQDEVKRYKEMTGPWRVYNEAVEAVSLAAVRTSQPEIAQEMDGLVFNAANLMTQIGGDIMLAGALASAAPVSLLASNVLVQSSSSSINAYNSMEEQKRALNNPNLSSKTHAMVNGVVAAGSVVLGSAVANKLAGKFMSNVNLPYGWLSKPTAVVGGALMEGAQTAGEVVTTGAALNALGVEGEQPLWDTETVILSMIFGGAFSLIAQSGHYKEQLKAAQGDAKKIQQIKNDMRAEFDRKVDPASLEIGTAPLPGTEGVALNSLGVEGLRHSTPRDAAKNSGFNAVWDTVVEGIGGAKKDVSATVNAIYFKSRKDKTGTAKMLDSLVKMRTAETKLNFDLVLDGAVEPLLDRHIETSFPEATTPEARSDLRRKLKNNKSLKRRLWTDSLLRGGGDIDPTTQVEMVENLKAGLDRADIPQVFKDNIIRVMDSPAVFNQLVSNKDFTGAKLDLETRKKIMESELGDDVYLPEDPDTAPDIAIKNVISETNNFLVASDIRDTTDSILANFFEINNRPLLIDEAQGVPMLTDDQYKKFTRKDASVIHKMGSMQRGAVKNKDLSLLPPKLQMDGEWTWDKMDSISQAFHAKSLPDALNTAHRHVDDPAQRQRLEDIAETAKAVNRAEPEAKSNARLTTLQVIKDREANNLDAYKSRKYIDTVNLKKLRGDPIELTEIEVDGIKYKVVKDAMEEAGASPAEAVHAHRKANYQEEWRRVADMVEEGVPFPYLKTIKGMPTFKDVSGDYQFNDYHHIAWNEDGNKKIRLNHPDIPDDYDISVNHRRQRRVGEDLMRMDDSLRLHPDEEFLRGVNKSIRFSTSKPLLKQVNQFATDYMGAFKDAQGNMISPVDSKGKISNLQHLEGDVVAESLRYASDHLHTINRPPKGGVKSMIADLESRNAGKLKVGALKAIDFVESTYVKGQQVSKTWALGSLTNPVYSWFNAEQFIPVGSQYISAFTLGKQLPKAHAEAFKVAGSYLKNKGSLDSYKNSLLKGAVNQQGANWYRYVEENINPTTFRESMEGNIHFDDNLATVKNSDPSVVGTVASAFNNLQRAMPVGSDIGARRGLFDAAYEVSTKTRAKYQGRNAQDLDHAAEFYSKMTEDLSIADLPSMDGSRLRKLMDQAYKNGDWAEFDYQYSVALADQVLFRYGKYYKSRLQDQVQKLPFAPARELATFRMNWPLNDRKNFMNIARSAVKSGSFVTKVVADAAKNNKAPNFEKVWSEMSNEEKEGVKSGAKAVKTVALMWLAGEVLKSKMDEYASDNMPTLVKKINHYVVDRLPGIRWVNNGSNIMKDDGLFGFSKAAYTSAENLVVSIIDFYNDETTITAEIQDRWERMKAKSGLTALEEILWYFSIMKTPTINSSPTLTDSTGTTVDAEEIELEEIDLEDVSLDEIDLGE